MKPLKSQLFEPGLRNSITIQTKKAKIHYELTNLLLPSSLYLVANVLSTKSIFNCTTETNRKYKKTTDSDELNLLASIVNWNTVYDFP